MRNRITNCLAVLGLMLALSMPSPAFGNHPEIEAALRALHDAREHLMHAGHNFGGHRDDAVSAIDGADRQLRICLQY